MTVMTATKARSILYTLIDQTKNYHEPIVISGKRNNAVLISEEEKVWLSEYLPFGESGIIFEKILTPNPNR